MAEKLVEVMRWTLALTLVLSVPTEDNFKAFNSGQFKALHKERYD